MKTNTELHDILKAKLDKTLRAFKLAYLKHLRTNKNYGHTEQASIITLYVNLYNDMFGMTYNFETLILMLKNECNEVIELETQQLNFKF